MKSVIRRRDKPPKPSIPRLTANSISLLPKLVTSEPAHDHSQVTNTILTQWTKPATKRKNKSLDEMVFLPHMRVAHCKNRKKKNKKRHVSCTLHMAETRQDALTPADRLLEMLTKRRVCCCARGEAWGA
jgi:hypothetical protein